MVISLGANLTQDLLRLNLRNSSGLTDADALPTFVISFNGTPVGSGTSVRASVGLYYPNISQPGTDGGTYQISWTFVVNLVTHTFTQSYPVYPTLDLTADGVYVPPEANELVTRVRYQLRDVNPEVHYSLVPMIDVETRERMAGPQSTIWDDYEIYLAIVDAVDIMNTVPPLTRYDLINLPPHYRACISQLARITCLRAKAINWIAQDMEFNLTTNTITVSRFEKYKAIADQEISNFNAQFPPQKHTIERYTKGRGRYFADGQQRRTPLKYWV